MAAYREDDASTLWKLYIWSGVSAIAEVPDADGFAILRTEHNQEYRFPFHTTDSVSTWAQNVTDSLSVKNDTHIRYLIFVWKNHWLDVPAADLRKKLLDLHPENRDAKIMLIGQDGFIITTLSQV